MRQIYIILTDTGTILSRIIKLFMKDEYAHVSIALDKKLRKMYSFGRLNPYNPFYGGFVHEHINRGTFKRFKKTKAKIMALNVNEEQYKKVEQVIKKVKKDRKQYKFNVFGLFAIYFKLKVKRKKCFYCAEFVKYVTEESDIKLNLPELIRPEDFKKITTGTVIYKGLLKEY